MSDGSSVSVAHVWCSEVLTRSKRSSSRAGADRLNMFATLMNYLLLKLLLDRLAFDVGRIQKLMGGGGD